MDETSLATFWAAVAFLIFVAVAIYFKAPGMMTRSLDERAERIRKELEDARKLREEAQQLLADYKRRRAEAEQEAAGIVDAARNEAAQLVEEARRKSEEYVQRRTSLAEQKIGQAEREAVNEVRARAVDIAVDAARAVLADKVDAKASAGLFKSSLTALKANLI